MELHIKDRIYIPQLLMEKNSFSEFSLKRSIINKVSISEEDRTKYNFSEDKDGNRITWDSKKDIENPLSVDFTKEELEYIKKSCESLVDTQYPDDLWATVEKIYDALK